MIARATAARPDAGEEWVGPPGSAAHLVGLVGGHGGRPFPGITAHVEGTVEVPLRIGLKSGGVGPGGRPPAHPAGWARHVATPGPIGVARHTPKGSPDPTSIDSCDRPSGRWGSPTSPMWPVGARRGRRPGSRSSRRPTASTTTGPAGRHRVGLWRRQATGPGSSSPASRVRGSPRQRVRGTRAHGEAGRLRTTRRARRSPVPDGLV